jgi:type IV pilus assembly protein PilA
MIRLANLKKREGFTLIELMIVVAIIGILAALAIPNFIQFQLRSKAGEGKVNLAAIRTAEEGYFAEFGTYILTTPSPAAWAKGAAAVRKIPWADAGAAPNNFSTMGWSPEGDVHFQYAAKGGPTGALVKGSPPNSYFTADAQSDLDGDTTVNVWGYIAPIPGTTAGIVGLLGCPAGGAYDPIAGSNVLLEVVGPCAAGMAQSIF